jgi:hypothetical protein
MWHIAYFGTYTVNEADHTLNFHGKVGSGDSKNTLYCSFCGKSQHEVRKLIAGPTVFHLRRMRRIVHGHHR